MGNDDSERITRDAADRLPVPLRFSAPNHKTIGLSYLWLALFSVFLGMAMSLLMRIHLVWPERISRCSPASATRRIVTRPLRHSMLADGFSGAHRGAPGWLRKLLPAATDWRTRNGLPHAEPARLLATVASFVGLTGAFLISPHSDITLWIVSVAIFCAASSM